MSEEKYVPFGGDKHVIRADARLAGFPPRFFATVVFRSIEELDDLIAALTSLRDGWDHPTGHIHLQDHLLQQDRTDPTRLEITFFTPTWADTDSESESRSNLIARARESLKELA